MALHTGNEFIDAIAGTPWERGHRTVGIDEVTLFLNFDNGGSGGAWSVAEQKALLRAAATWSAVANINFQLVGDPAEADFVERKATSADEGFVPAFPGDYTYGSHEMPNGDPDARLDGAFNTSAFMPVSGASVPYWTAASMAAGGIMFETFVHELGHGLGLHHPHTAEDGTGTFPGLAISALGSNGLCEVRYTIMSYNEPNGNDPAVNPNSGFAATPMAFDIAAVQALYGARESHAGHDLYILTDRTAGFSCIWDTGGIDTIEYRGTQNATLDLRPASLTNALGGGGWVSNAVGMRGGFTIAGDFTNFIANQPGESGVIIENATGGAGHDTIHGNNVGNTLRGEGGNDFLNGLGGNDTMLGGMGNDTYCVDAWGDQVIDVAGADGGNDKIYTTLVYFDLGDPKSGGGWVEELQYTGPGEFIGHGSARADLIVGGEQHDDLYGHELNDQLFGNTGGDTLDGGSGSDTLKGEAQNDTLIGGSENDVLDGGADIDTMYGGTGNDLYLVDNRADQVIEDNYAGIAADRQYDTVFSYADEFTLGDNVEELDLYGTAVTGIGNAQNNVIFGNALANRLFGNGGADRLYGGLDADYMAGGSGNDTYYVDNLGDQVFEQTVRSPLRVTSGIDTVCTTVSGYSLAAEVENLTLLKGVYSGTGNSLNNVMIGNNAANRLIGKAGNDTLTGGGGIDFFEYENGFGKDTITDFKIGTDRIDMRHVKGLYFFDQLKIEDSSAGAIVTIEGDTGNSITLKGLTAGDLKASSFQFANLSTKTFDGNALWGKTVVGTGGIDTLDFSKSTAMVQIDLEKGLAQTVGGAYADVHFSSIENATGGSNNINWILGNTADNVLTGGNSLDYFRETGGANKIDGRGGTSDILDYVLLDAPVNIDMLANRVQHGSYVDTVINVEQFIGTNKDDSFLGDGGDNKFTGMVGNDTARAGGGADWLEGQFGNDTLDGGGGKDKLYGGNDNDRLTGGTEADAFCFRTVEGGKDTITDFRFAEGDYIDFSEHSTVNAIADINITSDAAGNAVLGYAGGNTITLSGITAGAVHADWFHF